MNRPISVLAHHLGAATVGLGGLTAWAFSQLSLLAAPLAVAFVGLAFWWNLDRPEPAPMSAPRSAAAPERCAGCVGGCAGCRERIDVDEAA